MFIQESAASLTIRKAVTRIGKQHDDDVWVLGADTYVSAQGKLVPAKNIYLA